MDHPVPPVMCKQCCLLYEPARSQRTRTMFIHLPNYILYIEERLQIFENIREKEVWVDFNNPSSSNFYLICFFFTLALSLFLLLTISVNGTSSSHLSFPTVRTIRYENIYKLTSLPSCPTLILLTRSQPLFNQPSFVLIFITNKVNLK